MSFYPQIKQFFLGKSLPTSAHSEELVVLSYRQTIRAYPNGGGGVGGVGEWGEWGE
ncbi:MAG: hypothetical protein HEQ20_13655 [Aphanizomenon flos-aquae KM1D3_PB]|nr:MAG: hypothetical protein HEQ20_13655 [Aphanizomenon flos-aquae KM1D3_PB]